MTLYLIAHKVRGEAAFDVAEQITCPECSGRSNEGREPFVCFECDDKGHWWIIPTSGHRAYPFWDMPLDEIEFEGNGNYCLSEELSKMPVDLPDHYTKAEATRPKAKSLDFIDLEELGL